MRHYLRELCDTIRTYTLTAPDRAFCIFVHLSGFVQKFDFFSKFAANVGIFQLENSACLESQTAGIWNKHPINQCIPISAGSGFFSSVHGLRCESHYDIRLGPTVFPTSSQYVTQFRMQGRTGVRRRLRFWVMYWLRECDKSMGHHDIFLSMYFQFLWMDLSQTRIQSFFCG